MPRVLSWDVGIINLAYCLIEYNETEWSVIEWDLINLTDKGKEKCNYCNKNPKLIQELFNNTKKLCCKIHSKNVNTTPINFEDMFIQPEINQECCYEGKNKCTKKGKYIYNNQHLCNTHSKSTYNKIKNSYKLKNYNTKNSNELSIDTLRFKLVESLEKRSELLLCDGVIIENQPTLKNPKMKAISSTVYDYYLIRGIFDKKNDSKITKVKYISPSNKLKIVSDGDSKSLIKLKGDEAKTYKLTKSLSIKYCIELIETKKDKWLDHFNSYKKKDDLADCFLQGMYYINNIK
uniref:Mitochondrial resolvase Ydc2 catalytic domain-containing protein n=1 Tax=Megaviridae environmental sample TaxID=1737588 RepID=A0A5J6VKK1_9VIRU|nr:MAG: hypothetical protein [Megaviridae environmental sample]